MAYGCLQIPSQPLQNSVGGNLCNATALDLCAMPSCFHTPDRQSHRATAPTPDTLRSLPRSKTTPKTPRTPGDTGFSRSPSYPKHYPLRSLESISHPDFLLGCRSVFHTSKVVPKLARNVNLYRKILDLGSGSVRSVGSSPSPSTS